jgi:hypothetical protein
VQLACGVAFRSWRETAGELHCHFCFRLYPLNYGADEPSKLLHRAPGEPSNPSPSLSAFPTGVYCLFLQDFAGFVSSLIGKVGA